MIDYVELTVKLKVNWRKQPIEAVVRIDPGELMYYDAGELAAIEQQLGLSSESADGQCLKICLSELYNQECFESLREVLLLKIRDLEDVGRIL